MPGISVERQGAFLIGTSLYVDADVLVAGRWSR
jgi:hypothetical protein